MDEDFNNSDTVIIHNDIDDCYFADSHSDIDMGEVDNDMPLSNSMSMTNSYSQEWYRLFTCKDYRHKLNVLGLNGDLRSSRFRSLCWKIYLNILPDDHDNWSQTTHDYRTEYDQLKAKYIVDLQRVSSDDNPLSQEATSGWRRHFADESLRCTIEQDVVRTFPEIEFFKVEEIRRMMTRVLFCFARHHPRISYRQGMHELLAPLLFILYSDHQAYQHAREHETLKNIIADVMDPDFIEHDSFAMLSMIMEKIGNWFISDEVIPPNKTVVNYTSEPFSRSPTLHASNAILNKLTRVHDYVLKRVDCEIYDRLKSLDIYPQTYGIRWLRLLFGREFAMQDLLVIWDSLFADSFDLVDYVFVSMLVYLKQAIMESDYTTVMHLLMKYPQIGDVQYFVARALHIREPNKHPRPPLYFYSTRCRLQANEQVNIKRPKRKVVATPTSHTSSLISSLIRPMSKTKVTNHEKEMTTLDSSDASSSTSGFCVKCDRCSQELSKQIEKLQLLENPTLLDVNETIEQLKQIKDILNGAMSTCEDIDGFSSLSNGFTSAEGSRVSVEESRISVEGSRASTSSI